METCTDTGFWILLQSLREKQVSYLTSAFVTNLSLTPRTKKSVVNQLHLIFNQKLWLKVSLLEGWVNLYFMPIFPISTHTPQTPPTSLGDRGKSGFFFIGGEAYVSDIWPLKNLGEFP